MSHETTAFDPAEQHLPDWVGARVEFKPVALRWNIGILQRTLSYLCPEKSTQGDHLGHLAQMFGSDPAIVTQTVFGRLATTPFHLNKLLEALSHPQVLERVSMDGAETPFNPLALIDLPTSAKVHGTAMTSGVSGSSETCDDPPLPGESSDEIVESDDWGLCFPEQIPAWAHWFDRRIWFHTVRFPWPPDYVQALKALAPDAEDPMSFIGRLVDERDGRSATQLVSGQLDTTPRVIFGLGLGILGVTDAYHRLAASERPQLLDPLRILPKGTALWKLGEPVQAATLVQQASPYDWRNQQLHFELPYRPDPEFKKPWDGVTLTRARKALCESNDPTEQHKSLAAALGIPDWSRAKRLVEGDRILLVENYRSFVTALSRPEVLERLMEQDSRYGGPFDPRSVLAGDLWVQAIGEFRGYSTWNEDGPVRLTTDPAAAAPVSRRTGRKLPNELPVWADWVSRRVWFAPCQCAWPEPYLASVHALLPDTEAKMGHLGRLLNGTPLSTMRNLVLGNTPLTPNLLRDFGCSLLSDEAVFAKLCATDSPWLCDPRRILPRGTELFDLSEPISVAELMASSEHSDWIGQRLHFELGKDERCQLVWPSVFVEKAMSALCPREDKTTARRVLAVALGYPDWNTAQRRISGSRSLLSSNYCSFVDALSRPEVVARMREHGWDCDFDPRTILPPELQVQVIGDSLGLTDFTDISALRLGPKKNARICTNLTLLIDGLEVGVESLFGDSNCEALSVCFQHHTAQLQGVLTLRKGSSIQELHFS